MPLFADAQHFLDLRLRLQHEVLRAAAADDQDAALAAVGLRVEHDGRRLVHVRAGVEPQLRSGERLLGHVHPDGDRKSTRLNSSHGYISYAVFCLKKKTSWRSRMPWQ